MGDLAGRSAGHPLASLPRVWSFPALRGYRSDEDATYARHDLDEQPPVPSLADQGWQEEEGEKPEWSIEGKDARPARRLTPADLDAVAGELPVPYSLRLLAGRRDLQRRIRSATACYLDLGDFAAETSIEGGYLIHVLSDQQWCLHWMVYLDADGNEAVVSSAEPIGFDLPADWPSLPSVIPIGSPAIDLDVCAHSFAEFLYRFWIERDLLCPSGQSATHPRGRLLRGPPSSPRQQPVTLANSRSRPLSMTANTAGSG